MPIKYVSSFLINWKGQVRYLPDLDVAGTEAFRITPDLKTEKISFRPDNYMRFRTNDDQTTDLFISVYAQAVDPQKAIKEGSVDYSYLMDQRKEVARSIYVIRFTFKNSMTVDQPLGMPDMSACQLVKGP